MRHQPSTDQGMPFSPLQLAFVVALHAAVWAALVATDARAIAPLSPTLQVRIVPPEPLPAAPALVKKEPAPMPKPQPKPATPRPQAATITAPANAPVAASVPAADPAPIPVAVATTAAPTVAVAPAPAPAAPAVTAPRFDADYLENPAPAYPSASRRLGEEGKVVLRVFVEPDGRPSAVEVRTGSGSSRLDDAALDAVRRWKFLPARRGAEAVGAWVLVPIAFHLKG